MKYRNLFTLTAFLTMAFSGLLMAQPVLPNEYIQPNVGISVSSFTGSVHGFSLNGEAATDRSSGSIASGDINGDGYDDIIIGARYADVDDSLDAGKTYIVFGKASGVTSVSELSGLDGLNGFVINGDENDSESGISVASGDINGDGYDDIIIGAYQANPNGSHSGKTYIVFGKENGFSAEEELSGLDGSTGFAINGEMQNDRSGSSVSSGDINGDGYDDVIVGATGAEPNGNYSGNTYIIFGKVSGFISEFELSGLDGNSGFVIHGETSSDFSGGSVSSGDVNGDGYEDVIIGAGGADPNGYNSGKTYIIFGKASGFSTEVELSELDGSNGFVLNGESVSDTSGFSVFSADINGDGFDDIIVGARSADPNGNSSGKTYIIFGKASGFSSEVELSELNGSNGFVLNGESEFDNSGFSVFSADINRDGFDDVLIGAYQASEDYGIAYIVFGKQEAFEAEMELSLLNGINGIHIYGEEEDAGLGLSLSSGDINGDGYDDVLIGAADASPNGFNSGKTYVFTNTSEQTITGNEGFRLLSNHAHGKVYDNVLGQFWTQGFTNSDAPAFGTNTWSWNHNSQTWQGLSDQENDTLEGGEGFLFYMFDDDDNSVNSYESFPKTIISPASFFSVDGYNVVPNIGWIYPFNDLEDGDYFLFGNPYTFRINWDKPTGWAKENLSNTFYVWSDSASQWLSWNGITGNKPDSSIISPFQSVFVQASGGTGSLAVRENASGFTGGGIYKEVSSTPPINFAFNLENDEFSSSAILSFHDKGEFGEDQFDGMLLQPLNGKYVHVGIGDFDSDHFYSINSLPSDITEELRLPLFISGLNTSINGELTLNRLDQFASKWEISLVDNQTGEAVSLRDGKPIQIKIDVQQSKSLTTFGSSSLKEIELQSKTTTYRYELVIKTDVQTSLEETKSTPQKTELFQNYPNPFNPSTTITFTVPQTEKISLEVFDMLGRKVATLLNRESRSAGKHTIQFDASSLSSGMYIYRLKAGHVVSTKKLTLIK